MELEKLIEKQSEQIAKLTDLFGAVFLQKTPDNLTLNALNYSHILNEGGDVGVVRKGRTQILLVNLSKEEQEIMRTIKNVRIRKDGRYEWQKMIGGAIHREIDTSLERLKEKVVEHKKQINEIIAREIKQKKLVKKVGENRLVDLCWDWYRRYKQGKIKSANSYESVIRVYLSALDKNIATYTKDDIQDFLNDITAHRRAAYACDTLKNVFADAEEKGLVKKNVIANLPRPKQNTKKGTWINLDGQRKILDTILHSKFDDSFDETRIRKIKESIKRIGEEVLFYIMTGARCAEALNTTINFEKCMSHVDGTKTKTASRYVDLSREYCQRLKPKWVTMFKCTAGYYSHEISEFLELLGIEDKTCHNLRHTFSTNLYYLGVDDKRRQALLGHSSIAMTQDIYTTLDPTIKRDDIINLYGNYYPFTAQEKAA